MSFKKLSVTPNEQWVNNTLNISCNPVDNSIVLAEWQGYTYS